MTEQELEYWRSDFEAYQSRFAHHFSRTEPREQAVKYVRGLLAPVKRKNSWQLAEAVGEESPDPTQRLLYRSTWEADAARDTLQEFLEEEFGESDAIVVIDETGFLKQGAHSVGVQRQYCGTAGKVTNCQVATFLSYLSSRGHVLLDRRLYLPKVWCRDHERRKKAQIPAAVTFATKPRLAAEMLNEAWRRGIPMRWVTGDEVYGNAAFLRETIEAGNCWYVLAVSATCPAWGERPAVVEPSAQTGDRPRAKSRLAADAPSPTTVAEVVAGWSPQRWKRLTVALGEKGPRRYDWGFMRVVESRRGQPGSAVWLLARRSVPDPQDLAYYLSNAPPQLRLLQLAKVASSRYTIEQCFEEAKGETGLDEYEVRTWHSWHRHLTLSMMAYAWLSSIRAKAHEKGGTRIELLLS
jgi:SRSO17 transposase